MKNIASSILTFPLLWKAWRESKTRFFVVSIALIATVFYIVTISTIYLKGYALQHPNDPFTYTEFIWQALYNYYFQGLWIAAVIILGLGGLVWEHGLGVSSFTLSLPMSRFQIMETRFVLGAIQSALLAIIPSLLITVFSFEVGQSYPLIQAVKFGFLLAAAGLIFHGLSLFLSSILPGDFGAFLVGITLSGTLYFLFKFNSIHAWSIFDVMSGARVINPATHLIDHSMPWIGIIISLVICLALFAASVQIVRRRDF